jgi:hypothetical protein
MIRVGRLQFEEMPQDLTGRKSLCFSLKVYVPQMHSLESVTTPQLIKLYSATDTQQAHPTTKGC